MNVIDLNHLTHRLEDLQERSGRALWCFQNDAEAMLDDFRSLMRAGGDAKKDLDDAETFTSALLLTLKLLQRELKGRGE